MERERYSAQSRGTTAAAIGSNGGKFTDRNPDMITAGKLITVRENTAKDCLSIPRVETPDTVKKFRNFTHAEPQVRRVFYGKANDVDIASHLTHGVPTSGSLQAGNLVNPDPKTLFNQRYLDKKESLYANKQRAPLGKSHDQTSGLPDHVDIYGTSFGLKNVFDGTAGELVNPNKSYQQVYIESMQGNDLYKLTHHDFEVGEGLDRNYDWSRYPKDGTFGIATPHENDGKHVSKSLKWLRNDQLDKGSKIVSKRVDDFRERTQPQLGKVHDPIKDTMRVSEDHTFGILIRPDEYGAGDLMHCRVPGDYLRGKERQRGLLSAVRQQLKKSNYHNFNDLSAAFRHYDKNGDGRIDINELQDCCLQFNLPVDPELLIQLISYCDANNDGTIDYNEFANFLNWKDKMSSEETLLAPSTAAAHMPDVISKQIDQAVGEHRTSSSMINAAVGGVSTQGYRKYGVPTIRSDLAPPIVRRISDRTNYGDESNTYGLVNPSVYSNRGVYEKDFFQPRNQGEVKSIFENIGMNMDSDTFQKMWTMAASQSEDGTVSVESFRNVLDDTTSGAAQKLVT
ncbi:EF-hand domain-containing family member B-like [Antedon mediterranea]|uniref:EF-hand domain-containing family member B-like n=1 Tax=Antedon mediterranea TaxID=105859 RepID=UPI003AF9507E